MGNVIFDGYHGSRTSLQKKRSFGRKGCWILNKYCAGSIDSPMSMKSFIFTVYLKTISWKANLWPVVFLSSTEVEYITITEATKEVAWLKGLKEELR